MVAVISSDGIRLMPTSNYRARKLLAKGKAVVQGFNPFTVRLTDRQSGDKQPVEETLDTGYVHARNSLKTAKHELAAVELQSLTDEKQRHDDQRMHKNTRRSRKRHRKPRFNNRKRKEGWFPPSILHRADNNMAYLRRIVRVVPVTDVYIEMGEFDIQVLKAIDEGKPIPKGADYQHGERYGIETLRAAVFTKDNFTCQCCGRSIKDGAILHAHHIKFRSQGGTNKMGNLITVCEKCHTPANHKPGGKLFGWEPKVKEFKGETFMTSVRWMILNTLKAEFPDINFHVTYGAKTKCIRRELDISKSHVNDAYVMGNFHPKHRARPKVLKKKRRNNRILEKFYDAKYIDSRDGTTKTGQQLACGRTNRNHNTDTENLRKYRKARVSKGRRLIRTRRYLIQPHDKVIYQGKISETSGCHCKGTRVIIDGRSVSVKKVKFKRYGGAYTPVTTQQKGEKET